MSGNGFDCEIAKPRYKIHKIHLVLQSNHLNVHQRRSHGRKNRILPPKFLSVTPLVGAQCSGLICKTRYYKNTSCFCKFTESNHYTTAHQGSNMWILPNISVLLPPWCAVQWFFKTKISRTRTSGGQLQLPGGGGRRWFTVLVDTDGFGWVRKCKLTTVQTAAYPGRVRSKCHMILLGLRMIVRRQERNDKSHPIRETERDYGLPDGRTDRQTDRQTDSPTYQSTLR